jgi:hypothetical protein
MQARFAHRPRGSPFNRLSPEAHRSMSIYREGGYLMKDAKSQLKSLLAYWLEHNREHGAEFREWADKMMKDQPEVAGQLRQTADKMAEVDELLKKAQKLLN